MRIIKKYYLLSAIVCLGAMIMPCHAGATLMSQDDAMFGLGSITHDTDTGLDWLDLTVTQGLSYNNVSSQLGAGGSYDGWRYASTAEVNMLMVNAGIPDIGTWSTPNAVPTLALIDLIGVTDPLPGYSGALGLTDAAHTVSEVSHEVSLLVWDSQEGSTPIGFANPSWDVREDHLAFQNVGSHLVRGATDPIPEPATMLLFGTGLAGLAGTRIRKKKK